MSVALALLAEIVVALEDDPELARRLRAALVAQPQTNDGEVLISARDAGVPPAAWRRAIRRGELNGVRLGRELRARRSDVAAWLATLEVARHRRAKPRTDLEILAAGGVLDLDA